MPRLLQLLSDSSGGVGERVRLESAVTLGSLAKGSDQQVRTLIELGVVPPLLQVLLASTDTSIEDDPESQSPLVEACLRCLRTVFHHTTAPVHAIYQDPGLVPRLLTLAAKSVTNQVCVATILRAACKVLEIGTCYYIFLLIFFLFFLISFSHVLMHLFLMFRKT